MKNLGTIFSGKVAVALLAIASMVFVTSCKDDDDDDDNVASASVTVGDATDITATSAKVSFRIDAEFGKIADEDAAEIYADIFYAKKSDLEEYFEEYDMKSLKELVDNDVDALYNNKIRHEYQRADKNKTFNYNITNLTANTEYVYVVSYLAYDYSRISAADLAWALNVDEDELSESDEKKLDEFEKKCTVAVGVTEDKTFKTLAK